MQFRWLEKWAEDGLVSQEAKDRIYADCRRIIKTANVKGIKDWNAVRHEPSTAPSSMGTGARVIAKRVLDNKMVTEDLGEMKKTRDKLMKDPVFKSADKEKFKRRFYELAAIAPSSARDEEKAKNILERRLDTGFSQDDVMSYALLEAAYQPKDPDKALTPSRREKIAAEMGEKAAIHYQLIRAAAAYGQPSEKTAGAAALKRISPSLTGATMKDIIRAPLLMAGIPLLIGAGMGGIKELMERRNQVQMQKRLEGSFHSAMAAAKADERSVLHDNPEMAREAFKTLSNFAPHVALEPMAAKAFMSRIVSYNQGIGMEDLRTMSEVEKNVNSARSAPRGFSAGFSEGAGAMGLPSLMSSTLKSTYQPFLDAVSKNISNGV